MLQRLLGTFVFQRRNQRVTEGAAEVPDVRDQRTKPDSVTGGGSRGGHGGRSRVLLLTRPSGGADFAAARTVS